MRYIEARVKSDLQKKMVFVGGPRQVGKTTMAKNLLAQAPGRYFNWDFDEDRQALLAKRWVPEDRLLVFDELHKYPKWKNWVKGIYDVQGAHSSNQSGNEPGHQILVTGSARLDVYSQGGDSLLGRYHHWRLHPFTLDERPSDISHDDALRRLLTVGGFPEPFLENDERQARRWRQARFDRVLQEDIRDLESIKNIQQLRLFVDLLRQRVGGAVVLANLARDVQISPVTAKAWLAALERMYLIFCVYPYTAASERSIQKPPKVYFFDNADLVDDPNAARGEVLPGFRVSGAQFENLVATHLLKRLHYSEDFDGHRMELAYVRDKDGREVDFAVIKDGKLEELIEVKLNDTSVSTGLRHYQTRLNATRATQIVAGMGRPFEVRIAGAIPSPKIRVSSLSDYLDRGDLT
jgi:uncharacterized protein